LSKIGIIGAGSWGTALGAVLSSKGFNVNIWDADEEHLNELALNKENRKHLPGVHFDEKMIPTKNLEETLSNVELALFSAPAQNFRAALVSAQPYLNEKTVIVNVAKGIEQNSLKRMSEIASEYAAELPYVVLSGPSHAEEVGRFMPTTVAAASADIKAAEFVQDIFFTDRFRVYTNHDVIGVELGGALKNIIALGAGISAGMGYGDNALAALMTRGLAEMARLGVRLGAEEKTFSGLTGIGDLIVTCTSMHSRNRKCGVMIGEGMSPKDAVKKIGMVVEGIFTASAAYELSRKMEVDMPITESIHNVINGKIEAKDAVNGLMMRSRKHEGK